NSSVGKPEDRSDAQGAVTCASAFARNPRQARLAVHYSRLRRMRRHPGMRGGPGLMATAARDRLARTLRGDAQAAFSVDLSARTADLSLQVEGFGQVRFPVT